MKLGILETDHPEPALQEIYGTYSEMFQKLFSAADSQMLFKSYDVTRFEYPENKNDCDAYLITGSRISPYENFAWIRRLEEEIQILHSCKKKLIGICFGHQLIAQALGGEVKKCEKGWGIGRASRELYQKKPWMDDIKKTFTILVSHQDQVLRLPPGAERIAGNSFCPNASFQIGDHILTFQGHPEFEAGYLRQLITARRKLIGANPVEQALTSLEEKNDHQKIAHWIINFMKRRSMEHPA